MISPMIRVSWFPVCMRLLVNTIPRWVRNHAFIRKLDVRQLVIQTQVRYDDGGNDPDGHWTEDLMIAMQAAFTAECCS